MATLPPPSYHWQYTELLDDRNFQIRGRTSFYVAVLFSVVLLIALIFLYARWLCGFTPNSSSAPPSRGLERSAIDCLPVVVFNRTKEETKKPPRGEEDEDEAEAGECSICLGMFEEGEKIKVLPPCRHCYHCECVDRWLSAQPVCPLCRANLRVASGLELALP